jgi:hypothetical protein
MSNEEQVRINHFAELKSKYQATKSENPSPSSLLYFILRKVELGIEINQFELDWLRENELFETINLIEIEQYKLDEDIRLEVELHQLREKYKVPDDLEMLPASFLYPVLWKLDSEHCLDNSEIELLKQHNLNQKITIARAMGHFKTLKEKYEITDYLDSSPESLLYRILQKLDLRDSLSDLDANWLINNNFFKLYEIFEQQEKEREVEAEFSLLKSKYGATEYPDTSVSSYLYKILKKLDADQLTNADDLNWLKQQGLQETVNIIEERSKRKHFAFLKEKYKATQYQDSSPSSNLYKILQLLESGQIPSDEDMNYLRERELTGTIAIAQQKQFNILKRKYRMADPRLPFEPFYDIMMKLERGERLDRIFVAQLINERLLARGGEIAKAYHKLEATFYEQEYKRTGNKWNLVSAVSDWRKAGEFQKALNLTYNLDLSKVSGDDLKAALLTNRGSVFRDIEALDEAEKCALQAIEYQPEGCEPYILMTSICFKRSEFYEGEIWRDEAIERGAKFESVDYEMERLVKNTKNKQKQQELVEYLLNEDPVRYAWAKSYQ